MKVKEIIHYLAELARAHQTFWQWLSFGSLFLFLATPLLVIFVLVKLPAGYFVHAGRRRSQAFHRFPVVWLIFLVLKNLLGFLLVVAGFMLLFLPGQGFLTILIGLMLINFPGKRRLERLILSKPGVRERINQLRKRFHQPPLQF